MNKKLLFFGGLLFVGLGSVLEAMVIETPKYSNHKRKWAELAREYNEIDTLMLKRMKKKCADINVEENEKTELLNEKIAKRKKLEELRGFITVIPYNLSKLRKEVGFNIKITERQVRRLEEKEQNLLYSYGHGHVYEEEQQARERSVLSILHQPGDHEI